MKSTWTKAGLVLALACALGLTAFAQTPAPQTPAPRPEAGRFGRHGHMGRGGAGFERRFEHRALRSLNLSDAQHQQFKAIRERYQQSFQPQRQELRQLAEIRRNGGTWSAEQEARARELHTQLRANAEKLRAEMNGVLTPEQQQQLKQEREQFRERMKERRERFGAPPSTTPPPDKN
jgi:Spy/CpxP family protein refolding chaperone